MLIIDKRTPANIEYREKELSGVIGTRLVSLLGVEIMARVFHDEIVSELEFVLYGFSFPKGVEVTKVDGDSVECSDALVEYCRNKKRVRVCRDWMDGTIYMGDISDVEQEPDGTGSDSQ